MESSGVLPRIDFLSASSRLLGGKGAFSPSTENGSVSVAGASGFPAVDVRLVPRLDSFEEAGFENFTFFFLEAGEGVTHSFDFFPDDILIHHIRYTSIVVVSLTPM